MEYFILQLVAFCLIVGVCVGEHSVSILTDPSQGPFRFEQTVQFTCLVEPTPPGPVDYQWRGVEVVYGETFLTGQNFSRSYSFYNVHLRYCYYFCEASMNGTLLGSASRIIELQGFLYTEEPVVHSFTRGRSLVLNVNVSDSYFTRHINTLTWYHNGTKIVSGNKYSISTMLRITNMAGRDAGRYEAKIESITYNGATSSPTCDAIVVPLMESIAAHAPVTFTVQEGCVPTYDPSPTITILSVTDGVGMKELRAPSPVLLNLSLSVSNVFPAWYRNGTDLADGDMYNSTVSLEEGLSLQIQYNNTADITGDYFGLLWTDYYHIDNLHSMCRLFG